MTCASCRAAPSLRERKRRVEVNAAGKSILKGRGISLDSPSAAPSQKKALEQGQLDRLSINTIRCLAMDACQMANSGHPGLPMGAAAMAYVLWTRFLRHNPRNPLWPNRDRFVLSAGHGSLLLYGLLHLSGYDLSLDDLKQSRRWCSKTPGHPEYAPQRRIETT